MIPMTLEYGLAIAFVSLLVGIVVHRITALLLNRGKANNLPGGAVGAGFFVAMMVNPWYLLVAVPFALVGHFVSIRLTRNRIA